MTGLRKVEIFSAGCPVCRETVDLVNELSCPSCEVMVYDMHSDAGAARAKALGVSSVPAVAVNDRLIACCTGRGISRDELEGAGIGKSL